jgi:hypothetical protein
MNHKSTARHNGLISTLKPFHSIFTGKEVLRLRLSLNIKTPILKILGFLFK